MEHITLNKLVSCMKEFSKSNNLSSQFQFLFSLLSPYGIKIRYEMVDNRPKDKQSTQSYFRFREKGTLQHPSYTHLDDADVKVSRVILTGNRERSDFTQQITFECNGAILDSETWDVLVYPQHAINLKYSMKFVTSNISKYTIYPINDGTMVNLYYYNGSWQMGSVNGWDISSYTRFTNKTYKEMFNELLTMYPNFSYDKLNTECSYSLIFRHHDMHCFKNDTQKILAVCMWNSKTNTVSNDNFGIPYQQKIVFSKGKVSLETLQKRNATALKNFQKNKLDSIPDYGYILRGDFNECGADSCIMLESTLMKAIREMLYKETPEKNFLQPAYRLTYIVLRGYLNKHNRSLFEDLFPEITKQKYCIFIDAVNKITDKVINKMRQNNVNSDTNKINDKIVKKLLKIDEHINAFDPMSQRVIKDYISNIMFIDDIMNIIYPK